LQSFSVSLDSLDHFAILRLNLDEESVALAAAEEPEQVVVEAVAGVQVPDVAAVDRLGSAPGVVDAAAEAHIEYAALPLLPVVELS
jgi:hypothetical protein